MDEVAKGDCELLDQVALVVMEELDHWEDLAGKGSLEEEDVLLVVEEGLGTGLHSSECKVVVASCETSSFLVDVQEGRRWVL